MQLLKTMASAAITAFRRRLSAQPNRLAASIGRQADLLAALNAAATSIQSSSHSEESVLTAASEQISALGLRGGIILLDAESDWLTVRKLAYTPRMKQILAAIEHAANVRAEGFRFESKRVEAYKHVLESGQPLFMVNSSIVVVELVPEAARPFVRYLLKHLRDTPAIFSPLRTSDRVWGVLLVAGPKLMATDGAAVEAFGNHIAIALDNANLFAKQRAFNKRLVAAQENERVRIARELHDSFGQILTVLRMDAEWIATHIADRPDVVQVAESVRDKAEELLRFVRELARDLRPPVLDDLGVDCALESLATEVTKHSGISCNIDCSAADGLSDEVATAIYRIAQEALTNVVRHSKASNTWLTFENTDSTVKLLVEDDGIGISQLNAAGDSALGISSMRERVHLLGGEIRIGPRRGGGTSVIVLISY